MSTKKTVFLGRALFALTSMFDQFSDTWVGVRELGAEPAEDKICIDADTDQSRIRHRAVGIGQLKIASAGFRGGARSLIDCDESSRMLESLGRRQQRLFLPNVLKSDQSVDRLYPVLEVRDLVKPLSSELPRKRCAKSVKWSWLEPVFGVKRRPTR